VAINQEDERGGSREEEQEGGAGGRREVGWDGVYLRVSGKSRGSCG